MKVDKVENFFKIRARSTSAPLALISAWAAFAGFSEASAQEAIPIAGQAAAVAAAGVTAEDVIVTGTRTQSTTFESLAPVQVVGAAELKATGAPDLRAALSQLVPSYQNVAYNGSSASKPVRTATLRGLGGNHVLVLINGQRRHATSLLNNTAGPSVGSAPVDLALIPFEAVKRIEVLQDGAAAQYGSDAIAGVINIILKDSDAGGSASVEYGEYNHEVAKSGGLGDAGRTWKLDFNQGFALGDQGGFLNLSASYLNVGETNNVGPQKAPTQAAYQIYAAANDPREATANRYRQMYEVVPAQEGGYVAANLELPLNSAISLYSTATGARRVSESFGTYRSETNAATIVGASPPGGYLPVLQTSETDYQVDAGLKGEDFLGWDWDANLSYARHFAEMHVFNGINASFGGTVPSQDFFIGELITQEAIAAFDVQRDFETGLFPDPLQVAAGVEYRYNDFQQNAGEYYSYASGGYIFPNNYPAVNLRGRPAGTGAPFMSGYSPADAGDYDRNNQAIYIDLTQPVNDRWDLALAGRFENYSDFGETFSGKLSSRYEFLDGFAVRATISNGFRAPSLAEQFYTNANQGPQANPLVAGTFYQQNSYNSLRVNHPAAVALGAKPLDPEESKNYSIGFVAAPAPNFNLSVDFFQIDISDRIYLTGAFNGRTTTAVRNLLLAAGVPDPLVSVQYFTNIGDTRTRGLDLKADYLSDFGDAGTVKWDFSYALSEQDVTAYAPTPPQLAAANLTLLQRSSLINIREGLPKSIVRLGGTWSIGKLESALTATYYAHTRQTNNANINDPAYDSVSKGAGILDLRFAYDLTDATRISFGVNNLLNKKPDNIPLIAEPFITSGYTYPEPVRLTPYGTGGSFYYLKIGHEW